MKRKIIFAVFMIAVVSISMSIGALAATSMEKITAYLNHGIKFIVNGQPWTPQQKPISYNNTTYLPIRAVAEATGIKISWNEKTQTINLETAPQQTVGSTGAASGSTSETATIGKSRSNPAPVGTEVPFVLNDILLGKVTGSVKVEEIIRGDDAWKAIRGANMFNNEPKQGFEYILAKIAVKVESVEKNGAQFSISPISFILVSSSGKDYNPPMVVEPDPQLNANLYAGASHTGWAAFQVAIDDANPLITFGRNFDGTGGIWLKTN